MRRTHCFPVRGANDDAPQALELLNGQTSNELASVFAARLLKERATRAGRWCVAPGRRPRATTAEKRR